MVTLKIVQIDSIIVKYLIWLIMYSIIPFMGQKSFHTKIFPFLYFILKHDLKTILVKSFLT